MRTRAEALGARIAWLNDLDGGLCVRLELPLEQWSPPPAGPAGASTAS
jgi:hypothetical protein